MKLLYVWIESFQNIQQQGFVVDDEFKISISIPQTDSYSFYDSQGTRILGNTSSLNRKIFHRKLSFKRNCNYSVRNNSSPIQSIAALVGENASGKSSIIKCIHQVADQFKYQNTEGRYFLLAFLDNDRHSIVVRTRDIWLIDAEDQKRDFRNTAGYEEYIFPLTETASTLVPCPHTNTKLISIYQNYQEKSSYLYQAMGMSAIPINIAHKNFRNSFNGIFDFLCEFPQFGGSDNQIVFYLQDEDSRESKLYFQKDDLTPDEYKDYFLRKLSQLLFGALRKFLYHEEPQFTMAGTLIKHPEDEILHHEDIACAEVLSFCTFEYPHSDGVSLVKTIWGSSPETSISEAIAFFKKSTYVHMGKTAYDQYLECVDHLFSALYKLENKYFPALYKVSLPVNDSFRYVVDAFYDCISYGETISNCADSIIADFEWFSAGQYQIAIMFSGLYQQLKDRYANEKDSDLILMLDEPETHMHPEVGRYFIEVLNRALTHFQTAGLFRYCQIILATHSPFLIQSLNNYPATIALTKTECGQIKVFDFENIQHLHLPGRIDYSFNLVMYYVFNVPTIELHDELYGHLQVENKCSSEKDLDDWFLNNTSIAATKLWIAVIDGKEKHPCKVTLQRYIRNFIHHPENTRNQKYTLVELRQSIEEMLSCLKY